MATIILRSTNSGPLTNAQVDSNFTNLNDAIVAEIARATNAESNNVFAEGKN